MKPEWIDFPMMFRVVLFLGIGALFFSCLDSATNIDGQAADDLAGDIQSDETDVFEADTPLFDFDFREEDGPEDASHYADTSTDAALQDVSDAGACQDGVTRQPYLQNVTPTSIMIFWRTASATPTLLEYGPTEALGEFVTANEMTQSHRVSLTGLMPENTYYYRVSYCSASGDIHPFSTAPNRDTPFRFAVYGDSQQYPDRHRQVVARIRAASPDLVLHVGDTVSDGWLFYQYDEQFFGPAAALLASVPIYISLSNHEAESIYFFDSFYFGEDNSRYSFTYGNTFFMAFDTNRPYVIGTSQYEWLQAQLVSEAALQAEFRVVFFHRPPYGEASGNEGAVDQRDTILPLFEASQVDAVFNGHIHDYERGHLNGVTYFISGGGGGNLDEPARDVSHIVFNRSAFHFINVEVSGNTMSFSAVDLNGAVFDTYQISH